MKHLQPRQLIAGLAVLIVLVCSQFGQAQERPKKVVYGEDKQPLYMEREIIVRFDPQVLRIPRVDDLKFQAGWLTDFINPDVVELISQTLGYDAANLETFKIFSHLTSADTLSIDRLGDTVRIDDHWATLVLQLPWGAKEQEVCDNLEKKLFPLVRYAHLNWVGTLTGTGTPFGTPTDPDFARQGSLYSSKQYPYGSINVLNAWTRQTGKSSIKVGVLDTGIDSEHPDFNDNGTFNGTFAVVAGGYNYPYASYTLRPDIYGHGTGVAGIIGARRNNRNGNEGIAGIAGGDYSFSPVKSGVQLYNLQVFDTLNDLAVADAMNAIVDGSTLTTTNPRGFGLHILNNSYGYYTSAPFGIRPDYTDAGLSGLKDAVRTAYRNKCIFVASRGNGDGGSSLAAPIYPACYADDWVINVGASGFNGKHKTPANGLLPPTNFDNFESNYGANVDLIAPGTKALVYTTRSRSAIRPPAAAYQTFNGTSASAPHVAGVAALILSHVNNPARPQDNLTPEDVEQVLQRSAYGRPGNPAFATLTAANDTIGWGLLDASKALRMSDPIAYRFVHTAGTSLSILPVPNITTVRFSNDYAPIYRYAPFFRAGSYTARVYQVMQTIPAPLNADQTMLAAWPRNSSATLWGPPNIYGTLTTEAGIRVTALPNQNSATVEGYAYEIQDANMVWHWVPENPNNGAHLDLTFYIYNPEYDFADYLHPNQRSATGFASAAYPTPATDAVTLTFDSEPSDGALTVEVLTMTGLPVRHLELPAPSQRGARPVAVPLADLPTGLYTYRLTTTQGVSVGKFIKE